MTAVNGHAYPGVGRVPSPGCPFDSRDFRGVMGLFATGVTVLTAAGDQPHGMTANAFASVSKDPPLVLVCVDRAAVMHERIQSAGSFGISVLNAGQQDLARYFADRQRPSGMAQFATVDWVPGPVTGVPLLGGALAWLECALCDAYVAGDHSIFIGSVLDLARGTGRDALLFFGGRYRQLTNA
jgi:flavin reductase (DIM6/NTAB) family NADH-FMN oxidoreductase RutF